jgi:hypothetical protein
MWPCGKTFMIESHTSTHRSEECGFGVLPINHLMQKNSSPGLWSQRNQAKIRLTVLTVLNVSAADSLQIGTWDLLPPLWKAQTTLLALLGQSLPTSNKNGCVNPAVVNLGLEEMRRIHWIKIRIWGWKLESFHYGNEPLSGINPTSTTVKSLGKGVQRRPRAFIFWWFWALNSEPHTC